MLPGVLWAQDFNAGFVQGLWYADEQLFAGETTRVYVALRNHTGSDMTGTVTFYVNDEQIGRSRVSALDGRIIESWVDWTPTYGEHTLSATITKLELHSVGEETQEIEVQTAVAEDIIFVDYDTDGDGIGNSDDRDDDGDGVADSIEEKNGTDPLDSTDVPTEPEAAPQENEEEEHSSEESTPAGLEQYLTPSRAESALAAITSYTQTLKNNLDTYRANRSTANSTTVGEEELAVNEGGFGEITRSNEGSAEEPSEPKQEIQKEEGGGIGATIGAIFGALYGAVLAILSFTLQYPMLIQILLLLGILYGLYRLARRWGARPQ